MYGPESKDEGKKIIEMTFAFGKMSFEYTKMLFENVWVNSWENAL